MYDVAMYMLGDGGESRIVTEIQASNWIEAAAIAYEEIGSPSEVVPVGVYENPVAWVGTAETLPPYEVALLDDAGNALTGRAINRFRRYTVIGLLLVPGGSPAMMGQLELTQQHSIPAASWSVGAHSVIGITNGKQMTEGGPPADYFFVACAEGAVTRVAGSMDIVKALWGNEAEHYRNEAGVAS